MKFSILTVHPQIASAFFQEGLLAKACEKKLIEIECVHLRDYADAPHFRVDDKPYGGGPGMVLKIEPIVRALRETISPNQKTRIILLSAKGRAFTQKTAQRLSTKYDHLVLICGRYEGVDERVAEFYTDEELRVGDYVLMGGELGAGIIVEAVARLCPGILGNPESLEDESFSKHLSREWKQYTRPASFEDRAVPDVLLRGDHKAIKKWRQG